MTFRFQLFSDIHLETFKSYPIIPKLADYLFLAGDIGIITYSNYEHFFNYCSKNWKKVFYVIGNHEYYNKKTYDTMNTKYKDFFAKYNNVHLLDNSSYELDEVVIIGSTLFSEINDTRELNDFNKIHEYNADKTRKILLTKRTYNELHEKSKEYLIEQINNQTKPMIIMTRFPPIQSNTSDKKYDTQPMYLKKYFASNILKDIMTKNCKENINKIKCWIFGHTHYSNDFTYGTVRLISNQVGYIDEIIKFDNEGLFTIDL